ncbi:MAG TPA: CHASE3 domain-containing protein, partial [Pilimelia sp.]|nr:CHASE3 domain-containing protein [Pilimelia sp.]
MGAPRTFGQRVGAGFAVMVALTFVAGAVAVAAINLVTSAKDTVIDRGVERAVDVERLRSVSGTQAALVRGYLLTGTEERLSESRAAAAEFSELLAQLRAGATDLPQEQALLGAVEEAMLEYQTALEGIVAQRRAGASPARVGATFENETLPRRQALDS